MTHKDIYTKFMIEYDKADVTSSYPSLTPYEVATILDKAYLTLIARKLTGNNTRRVPFEYDTKAIEDLRPLVTSKVVEQSTGSPTYSDNEYIYNTPDDMLYYLEGLANYGNGSGTADNRSHMSELVNLVDHRTAQRFRATNSNMPWIKNPVSFLQDDDIHVLIDSFKHYNKPSFLVTYIKSPAKFVESLEELYITEEDPGLPVLKNLTVTQNGQYAKVTINVSNVTKQYKYVLQRLKSDGTWSNLIENAGILTADGTITVTGTGNGIFRDADMTVRVAIFNIDDVDYNNIFAYSNTGTITKYSSPADIITLNLLITDPYNAGVSESQASLSTNTNSTTPLTLKIQYRSISESTWTTLNQNYTIGGTTTVINFHVDRSSTEDLYYRTVVYSPQNLTDIVVTSNEVLVEKYTPSSSTPSIQIEFDETQYQTEQNIVTVYLVGTNLNKEYKTDLQYRLGYSASWNKYTLGYVSIGGESGNRAEHFVGRLQNLNIYIRGCLYETTNLNTPIATTNAIVIRLLEKQTNAPAFELDVESLVELSSALDSFILDESLLM